MPPRLTIFLCIALPACGSITLVPQAGDGSAPSTHAGAVRGDRACGDGGCIVCAVGEVMCSNGCTDLSSDVTNCGSCGTACAAGDVCDLGMCAISCAPDLAPCRGSCVDLASDVANCGACGGNCGG